MPNIDTQLPIAKYGQNGVLATGSSQSQCANNTPTSATVYGPGFVRAGDTATFTWVVSCPTTPTPPGDCLRVVSLGCSSSTSGLLDIAGRQATLTTQTDPLKPYPSLPAHSNVTNAAWYSFQSRYPLPTSPGFIQQGGVSETFKVSFNIDPNAPATTFSSPSSDVGPWAFIEANNWGMAVPFNIGANGAMKPGEQTRISQRNEGSMPGTVNSSGHVCKDCDPKYKGANSGQSPSSPGFGFSMGALYAKVALEADGATTYFNFYDGSGSFERWNQVAGAPTTPLYPDTYISAVKNGDGTFTLTFKDRSQWKFNALDGSAAQGRISTIKDRNNNTLTYAYNASGHVTSVLDGEGRGTYVSYGSRTDGQPVFVYERDPVLNPLDSVNRKVTYAYYTTGDTVSGVPQPNNRLKSITDSLGNVTTYVYEATFSRIYTISVARNGGTVVEKTYTYYPSGPNQGLVNTEQDYDKRLFTYTYNTNADNSGTITLDDKDLTTNLTRTTVNTYDRRRRLVKSVDPIGNVWVYEYHDSINPYLLTKIIDPNLNVTSMEYSYDSSNNVNSGNLLKRTDALGRLTEYVYDTVFKNQIAQIKLPQLGVNNYSMSFTYTPTTGNLATIVDTRNKTTTFDYTGRTDGRVTGITNRNGKKTTFTYTTLAANTRNAGNLETITFPAGSAVTSLTMTYDVYDNVKTVKDALLREVQYSWDNLNRLLTLTNPDTVTVSNWTYINDLLDTVNLPPNADSGPNRQTKNNYNNLGRLTSVQSQKVSAGALIQRVAYTYDGWNRLKTLTRKQNTVNLDYTYDYDLLDRVTSFQDPLSRQSTASYAAFCSNNTNVSACGIDTKVVLNAVCKMNSVTTPDEAINITARDDWDRPTTIQQNSGVGYKYDIARFDCGTYDAPAPTTFQTRTIVYDEGNRVTSVTFAPDSKSISYTYDDEGNVLTVTDGNGLTTTYTYTSDNRIKTVTCNGQLWTYVYDVAGQLKEIQYPLSTGIVAKFDDGATPTPNSGWDVNGRLITLRYVKGATLVKSFEYAYYKSGNRKTCLEKEGAVTKASWTYTYDAWDRLLTAVDTISGSNTTYTYDDADNRLTMTRGTTINYTYDGADQLATRGADTFTYNRDGNLISKTVSGVTTQYTWDSKNKIRKIKVNGVDVQANAYDMEGLRRSTDPNSKFYQNGGTSITDFVGANVTSYIQGHQILGMVKGATNYFALNDGLGSTRMIVNSSGGVESTLNFDEFGSPLLSYNDPLSLASMSYVGGLGVRDERSANGLYLMGQRWYDPTMGRFMSVDPISFAGGLNRHIYAGNDPTNRIDPGGLWESPPTQLSGLGVGPKTLNPLTWGDINNWNDPRAYVYQQGGPASQTVFDGSLLTASVATALALALGAIETRGFTGPGAERWHHFMRFRRCPGTQQEAYSLFKHSGRATRTMDYVNKANWWNRGVVNEVKTGSVRMTDEIRNQIVKDFGLRVVASESGAGGAAVEWHFYRDVARRIGADPEVLQMLTEYGIKAVFHF